MNAKQIMDFAKPQSIKTRTKYDGRIKPYEI